MPINLKFTLHETAESGSNSFAIIVSPPKIFGNSIRAKSQLPRKISISNINVSVVGCMHLMFEKKLSLDDMFVDI